MATFNDKGLQLIKSFEGFRSAPYLDSVKIPTIGYGMTHYPDGTTVTMKDSPIDESTASNLLNKLIHTEFAPQVATLIKVPITDNQFSACVSFSYNVGVKNFKNSTLLRCINNKNPKDAANEFLRWNKANGIVLAGLTRRRQSEKALFEAS